MQEEEIAEKLAFHIMNQRYEDITDLEKLTKIIKDKLKELNNE